MFCPHLCMKFVYEIIYYHTYNMQLWLTRWPRSNKKKIIVIDGYKLYYRFVWVFYNNAVKGQDTWKQINWRSPNIILTVSLARVVSFPFRPLFFEMLFMFAICNASVADNTKSTVGGSKWRTRRIRWKRKKNRYIIVKRDARRSFSDYTVIYFTTQARKVPEEFFILIFNTFSRSRLFLKTLLRRG